MFPLLPFPDINAFALFALVLSRIAGLFTAIPAIGGSRAPAKVRVALIFSLSLVLFPVLKLKNVEVPLDTISLAIVMLREVLIGLTLSILVQSVFAAVDLCGQIVGMQMGFTISMQFDPSMGMTSPISVVQSLFATLLFLALNGHHFFITAMVQSYEVLPVGHWSMSGNLISFLVAAGSSVFLLAIKLAAPVMVALLTANVALGIMARAFPQMNIFMLSLPVNIAVGFVILGMSTLVFMHTLQNAFGAFPEQMQALFRLLAEG